LGCKICVHIFATYVQIIYEIITIENDLINRGWGLNREWGLAIGNKEGEGLLRCILLFLRLIILGGGGN
jgi:hypothetical protein